MDNAKLEIKNIYNDIIKNIDENRILLIAEVEGIFITWIFPTEDELYILPFKKDINNFLDIRYLLFEIKNKNKNIIKAIQSPNKIINPKYQDLFLFINKNIAQFWNNNETPEELKNFIELIKKTIISSFDNNINNNEKNLIDVLTKTELKILKNIINHFNEKEEGDIKDSQATIKYKISTSVFRTLFYKIKEYKVAEIDNRGVKGTHIKFNNIKLIKELIKEGNL